MKIQLKFNNDDKFGFNNNWVRTLLLILALLYTISSLTHILYATFRFKGYEKVLSIFSGDPVKGLLFGAMFFTFYYVIKKSKPV